MDGRFETDFIIRTGDNTFVHDGASWASLVAGLRELETGDGPVPICDTLLLEMPSGGMEALRDRFGLVIRNLATPLPALDGSIVFSIGPNIVPIGHPAIAQ